MTAAEQRAEDVRWLEEQAQLFEVDAQAARTHALSEPDPRYPLIQGQLRESRKRAYEEAVAWEADAARIRRLLSYIPGGAS